MNLLLDSLNRLWRRVERSSRRTMGITEIPTDMNIDAYGIKTTDAVAAGRTTIVPTSGT